MMIRFLFFTGLLFPCLLFAQTDKWDLQRCVDYALQHNISVKQSDVQAQLDVLQSKLSKGATIPALNFNTQAGYQFGRNIDPTTNQFINQQVFFHTYSLQTNITLFNWFNIKNQVKAAETNEEASRLDVARVKSDISLNVVAAYLQLLLAKEQVSISAAQISLTDSQLVLTRKQVSAGSMPELNAAQLQSQLAIDSSSYITAISTVEQNRLQLMALLNLDAAQPFEVSVPDADKIPLPPLNELQPADLYQTALQSQPQQKVNEMRVRASQYSVKAARGAMYPTLVAFGSIGSNYASTYKEFAGINPTNVYDTVGVVNIGGVKYNALSLFPNANVVYRHAPYFRQIGNINLNQSIGVQLNVPILNGRQLRTNYERAKLNVNNYQLQQDLANQTLQQNIYTARANAESAIQKFHANQTAASYAKYANELSRKRYEIGMLSTSDYLVVQNNLTTAEFNLAAARYDYIFRIKLLEYYKFGSVQL